MSKIVKCGKVILRFSMLPALILSSFPESMSATAIAVIQTKTAIWIAADGKRSTETGKLPVCKIHHTPIGVIAKAGASRGFDSFGTSYSTDRELQSLIGSSSSAADFQSRTRQKLTGDLWGTIAFKTKNSLLTATQLSDKDFGWPIPEEDRDDFIRDVLLISESNGQLGVRQLMVSVDSIKHGQFYRYNIDTEVNWELIGSKLFRDPFDEIHPSLHQFGRWVRYNRDDAWIQAHPEQALHEVMAQSAQAYPDLVGPPFTILHLGVESSSSVNGKTTFSLKTTWIEHGNCPSWNDR